MKCETFRANMDRRLENMLPDSIKAVFDLHEKECLLCAKLLSDREWDRVGDPKDLKVKTFRSREE